MASGLSKSVATRLLKTPTSQSYMKVNFNSSSYYSMSRGKKIFLAAAGFVASGTAALVYALNESVKAGDLSIHPPKYPWSHSTTLGAIDINSARRGYQVYKQVCSACHSLQYVRYREFVGTLMTEDEAKAEAAEVMVQDGPDDEGNMFERPGKLADGLPRPYANEEAARAANNGAYPPDLTYITLARHGGEDYVFSLLTGYAEQPAGINLQEGQHFNPYMLGGAIAMAQVLYNDTIQYDDGTPPTASQLAKDVSTFLKWCAEADQDERKRLFLKLMFILVPMTAATLYWKRNVWAPIKYRKIVFKDPTKQP